MPRAAPSACTEPGCPALVHNGKSKCEQHSKQQTTAHSKQYGSRPENKQYADFYNSRTWRNISINHRKKQPLCMHCLEHNITKPADVVDHIEEIRDAYAKRFDTTNLESLCHACHNSKTAKVRKERLTRTP